MAYPTLNDRLIATGGRPSGFDYLRIGLATAVIFFHSFDLTSGHNVAFHDMHGMFRPADALILPMFFSLSGFLVAGSLERSRSLVSFLGLRAIRLVPALLVETVLSAILIGLLFSNIPYREYFSNPLFLGYFLNIAGDIHYYLPGVFSENPFSGLVNGQLWTLPWELKCYVAISIMAIVGVARRKSAFLALVVLLNIGMFVYYSFVAPGHAGQAVGEFHVHGALLVQSFFYGILLHVFRKMILWSKWIFLAATLVLMAVTSLPFAFWGDSLAPVLAAYITVYLGLLAPRSSKLTSSGDYSYGIYLYGFPVQQAMVAALGASGLHWYINFPVSLTITAMLAILSWHLVEKHAAMLRPLFFNGEKAILERYGAVRSRLKFSSQNRAAPSTGN